VHPRGVETFPFVGIGGLAAVMFLVVTYAAFAGLVRVLGAAASGLRISVVPGIVDGVRDWARPAGPVADADPPWEELPAGVGQVGAE
jgi:hypothetical protein